MRQEESIKVTDMSNLEEKRELIKDMIDRIDSDEYLFKIYHYILPKFKRSNKNIDRGERRNLIQEVVKVFDSIEDLRRIRFYHDFILKMEKEEG